MSFKVFIYNRITGKPQNLTRDIYTLQMEKKNRLPIGRSGMLYRYEILKISLDHCLLDAKEIMQKLLSCYNCV